MGIGINDIVLRIKGGEDGLYSLVFMRYWGLLYYMVYKIVGNREDTEDVLMVAFEKAYEGLGSWEPDYLFSTWLYKIARNAALDFKRGKGGGSVSLDVIYSLADSGRTPEEDCIEKDYLCYVGDMIYCLGGKMRDVMEYKINDMSNEDIAERTGMSHIAVRTAISRARVKLKKMIS